MNGKQFFVSVWCITTFVGFSCTNNDPEAVPDDDPVYEFSPESISSARYFDAIGGSDGNDGTSKEKAWKSLAALSVMEWQPGAIIYLKAGSEWHEQVELHGSGSMSKPILMTSYGEGENPLINGDGKAYALKLENQQYWKITNLNICNYSENQEGMTLSDWESNNVSYWANGQSLSQYEEVRSNRSAILVLAEDIGEVNHLHFKGLEVHGVNGDISDKDNGGIYLEITGNSTPTWFNDLLIEDCYIHDVDRTGISNRSSWNTRSLTTNTNWTPSKNIIIRNNIFERSGANALIVRVAHAPLMEHNLFDHCSIKGSGNASFSFNCDSALWQYNEARFTKYNIGDNDAGGFDSDYRSKHTILQYNYSHDNEYGGMLICCKGGSDRFNYGTIARYNVFANNKQHVIRVSGIPDETLIHNNVFYNSDDAQAVEVIWHKNWSGYPSNTSYKNNIFCSRVADYSIGLESSAENSFANNLFWGEFSGDLPDSKMEGDPLFQGTDYNGTPAPEFFRIQNSSPAKNAGGQIEQCVNTDYFGNAISNCSTIDIGIHEYE